MTPEEIEWENQMMVEDIEWANQMMVSPPYNVFEEGSSSSMLELKNDRERKREEIVLPFAKRLPAWEAVETEDELMLPHFGHLVKVNEDIREMRALAVTLVFKALSKDVENLMFDVLSSTLSSLHQSFAELEKNGFDVSKAQARISKFLSHQELENDIKLLLKKKEDIKVGEWAEILTQIEHDKLELAEKEAHAKEMMETEKKKEGNLEARLETIA